MNGGSILVRRRGALAVLRKTYPNKYVFVLSWSVLIRQCEWTLVPNSLEQSVANSEDNFALSVCAPL